jgi:Cys-rich repeat protein
MQKLPIARNTNIIEQESGKEVLIYDLKTHRFFNLNETSAIIYRACDGITTFADLKSKHKLTDDLIYFALDELKRNDLLGDYQSEHFGNLSRRAVIKKVGLASMIALPVITGMVAPLPVNAASGGCTSNADCAPPNVCDSVTGNCVECTADVNCPANNVCSVSNTCVECNSNADCATNPTVPICANNTCVECITDSDCPAASVCLNNICAPA